MKPQQAGLEAGPTWPNEKRNRLPSLFLLQDGAARRDFRPRPLPLWTPSALPSPQFVWGAQGSRFWNPSTFYPTRVRKRKVDLAARNPRGLSLHQCRGPADLIPPPGVRERHWQTRCQPAGSPTPHCHLQESLSARHPLGVSAVKVARIPSAPPGPRKPRVLPTIPTWRHGRRRRPPQILKLRAPVADAAFTAVRRRRGSVRGLGPL